MLYSESNVSRFYGSYNEYQIFLMEIALYPVPSVLKYGALNSLSSVSEMYLKTSSITSCIRFLCQEISCELS